jgi:hypothetical protein
VSEGSGRRFVLVNGDWCWNAHGVELVRLKTKDELFEAISASKVHDPSGSAGAINTARNLGLADCASRSVCTEFRGAARTSRRPRWPR